MMRSLSFRRLPSFCAAPPPSRPHPLNPHPRAHTHYLLGSFPFATTEKYSLKKLA